jgi:hypothetical protein
VPLRRHDGLEVRVPVEQEGGEEQHRELQVLFDPGRRSRMAPNEYVGQMEIMDAEHAVNT